MINVTPFPKICNKNVNWNREKLAKKLSIRVHRLFTKGIHGTWELKKSTHCKTHFLLGHTFNFGRFNVLSLEPTLSLIQRQPVLRTGRRTWAGATPGLRWAIFWNTSQRKKRPVEDPKGWRDSFTRPRKLPDPCTVWIRNPGQTLLPSA